MKKFNHLNIPDHWQHYWTRYPEGYTIVEALISWVSQVDDMVDNVNDWNEYLEWFVETFDERLAPTVRKVLLEMIEDGTMAEIINYTLFEEHMENFNSRGINIKLAGAVPDGITDNTEAIQNLLNLGFDLWIPEGVFLTNQLDMMKDNQLIHGVGTLKLADKQYSPIIYANGRRNAKTLGIKLDGNAKGNPLDNGTFEVLGVEVSSQNIGNVLYRNCVDSLIAGVRVENSHSSPLVLWGCTNSGIQNNVSKNHVREGMGIISGKQCYMNENISYYDPATGTSQPWSLFFTTGEQGDGANHFHKVIDNVAENSQAAFITINTEHTEVIGNTVRKTLDISAPCGPGIRLGHMDGTTTSGRAYNCKVADNTIVNINSTNPFLNVRGVSLDNASGSVVEDNLILDCLSGVGVSVTSEQDVTIKNNTIRNPVDYGVSTTSVKGTEVIDNLVVGGKIGLFIRGNETTVKGNTVKGYTTTGVSIKYGSGGLSGMTIEGNTVIGDVATNYDIDGLLFTNSMIQNNNGFYPVERDIIYVDNPPTTPTHKKGTVAVNISPLKGEPAMWLCVDEFQATWTPLTYYNQKASGTHTIDGDGLATTTTITHNLGSVPKSVHVQPMSSQTPAIKYVVPFNNNMVVHFNAPLPVGEGNIRVSWGAEL